MTRCRCYRQMFCDSDFNWYSPVPGTSHVRKGVRLVRSTRYTYGASCFVALPGSSSNGRPKLSIPCPRKITATHTLEDCKRYKGKILLPSDFELLFILTFLFLSFIKRRFLPQSSLHSLSQTRYFPNSPNPKSKLCQGNPAKSQ